MARTAAKPKKEVSMEGSLEISGQAPWLGRAGGV